VFARSASLTRQRRSDVLTHLILAAVNHLHFLTSSIYHSAQFFDSERFKHDPIRNRPSQTCAPHVCVTHGKLAGRVARLFVHEKSTSETIFLNWREANKVVTLLASGFLFFAAQV
jgi:hypothetical protein